MGLNNSSVHFVEYVRWKLVLRILNMFKGSISLGLDSLGHFAGHRYVRREGNSLVISIHVDMGFLQGKWQIIDVNQEQEYTKTGALRNSTVYSPHIKGGAIYLEEFFTVIQV